MPINSDTQRVIGALPGLYIILKPNHPAYTIVAASAGFLKSTYKESGRIIGKGVFEVFAPHDETHKRAATLLRDSFQKVVKTGKPDSIQLQKYDILRPCGSYEARYWRNESTPIFENGRLAYIIHALEDVTDRFQAEEGPYETQVRLNDTLSAGSVATWLWDITAGKVYGDKNYAHFFNVSAEEAASGLPPTSFVDVLHPDDRERIKEMVTDALQNKKKFETEYRIVNAKGAVRWVLARGRIEKNEKGEPIRFPGVLMDITDRKNAEEAVRLSEAQLKFMAEAMPQKVFTADAHGQIDYINPQWLEFSGLRYEEILGNNWVSIIHPDDKEKAVSHWQHSVSIGVPYEVELRYLRSDGVYRWHITRARAMRNSKQAITKWIGSSTDITENKQHALNLYFLARASEILASSLDYDTTLAKVAELAVPDIADWCAIDLYDPKNGLKQVVLAHKDPKKIKWAKHMRKKYPENFNPHTGVGGVITTGKPAFYPFLPWEMIKKGIKDKGRRDFIAQIGICAVIIAPLKVNGAIIGAITFVSAEQKRHFTEDDLGMAKELAHRAALAMTNADLYRTAQQELQRREQLEEKLREANEDLEARVQQRTAELEITNQSLARSNRELQDFAYVASHDLQEPLRKIQAFGNLLEDEYAHKLGEGLDYLGRMRKAASRMSGLIEDLLAFSRVTTMAQPFARVPLSRVVREVVGDLETRIQETGGKVKVGKLPSIIADPTQMRQLMQNLIGNALKFHRPNIPPVVKITAAPTKANDGTIKEYRISVADNGIGFEEKYLDRIFAVFQRLHGRDTYDGTGIGLAVCRKIVERHGGDITAASIPGKGSTFVVTIPAHPIRSDGKKYE